MVEKQLKTWFRKALFHWNEKKNSRKMPWKGIVDPYKIWLSEVMLQQTRVEQGMGYYNRFVEQFPTVHDLARANENQVFKLWEGLGYYARCRNLIATAQKVSFELKGNFPNTREGLLSLKGVGTYTAAAIGSFAFQLPLAVVDGNVNRVFSRFMGITEPIDQLEVKKKLELLAQSFFYEKNPAVYNQAIMDFGAVVCKPQQPVCSECFLKKKCIAWKEGIQSMIPVKSKKNASCVRFFNYLILEHSGKQLVRKRIEKDIWKDLYEFILMEKDEPQEIEYLQHLSHWGFETSKLSQKIIHVSNEIIHKLTHQKIKCRLIHIQIEQEIALKGYEWKTKNAIRHLPFPRLITKQLGW